MAPEPVRLTLYSRESCHLCHEMAEHLRELQAKLDFMLDVVDVGGDPELEDRFGEDVPVLTHGGDVLCRHRLDREAVTRQLAAAGARRR